MRQLKGPSRCNQMIESHDVNAAAMSPTCSYCTYQAVDTVTHYCTTSCNGSCGLKMVIRLGSIAMMSPAPLTKSAKLVYHGNFVLLAEGDRSTPFDLTDSVFQRTVLGPPLWNQHFSDARASVNALDYKH